MMIIIWVIAIIALVILEAATTQLIGIWFAVAALISLILALFEIDIWIQIVVFIVVSTALLLSTRPMAKRLLKNSPEHTNADRSVGETGIVIEEIENDKATGQVKVLGQTWSARSLNDEVIPVDEKVTVHSIDGVKLIVEVQKEQQESEQKEQTEQETEEKENI